MSSGVSSGWNVLLYFTAMWVSFFVLGKRFIKFPIGRFIPPLPVFLKRGLKAGVHLFCFSFACHCSFLFLRLRFLDQYSALDPLLDSWSDPCMVHLAWRLALLFLLMHECQVYNFQDGNRPKTRRPISRSGSGPSEPSRCTVPKRSTVSRNGP